MGKYRRGEKEFNREQRLIHENKKLKQQVSQLRKMLARFDREQYEAMSNALEDHSKDHEIQNKDDLMENLKKTWSCRQCESGFLKIIIISRRDGTHYFRSCTACKNRTKTKKFNDRVRGIFSDNSGT